MDTLAFLSHQHEDPDQLHARQCEGVVVVNPLLLDEPTCHHPDLVLNHRPCFMLLLLEHPFQGDWMMAVGQINKLLGLVLLNGLAALQCTTLRPLLLRRRWQVP